MEEVLSIDISNKDRANIDETVIIIENLTKRFGNLTAVDNISLNIYKGDIFAFLGPNGAGKSTSINMMTTITAPTSGKIIINGYNVKKQKDKVRKSIGVIYQDHTVDEELTAFENLYYHAVLYKIPRKDRKRKIDELLDYVGLIQRKNNFVKNFSGGMKRRVEIARGLLHSPEILFLDEPTLGLDVQTKNFLWRHIRKINENEGTTIFLTTHNMDEAEKIATRIAIIDQGKILIVGTSSDIKTKTNTNSLEDAFLKLTGRDIREYAGDSNIEHMRRFRR